MNGTMVAGEYRDDGTISIRLVLQEKPCFALKIGDKYALYSLAVEPSEPTCRYPFYDVDNQTLQWTDTQGNVWERKFINGVWKDAWIVEEEVSDLDGKVFTRPDPELIGQAITARDERIRREESERLISKLYDVRGEPDKLNVIIMHERAAIMGGKE